MNVIELLQGQLDPNLVNQLTQQIGAETTEQTEAVASGMTEVSWMISPTWA